jgi:hypothetical protein
MMLTWPDVILMMQLVVIVRDKFDAANTGSHRHPDAMTVVFADLQPGVFDGVDARGNAIVDEGIVLALFLGREVLVDIEVPHAAGNSRGEATGVEILDETDTGITLDNVLPGIIQPAAHRRDDPHAGDDNATFAQCIADWMWRNRQSKTRKNSAAAITSAAAPDRSTLAGASGNEIDSLLYSGDLLGFLVGDFGLELFFQSHDQLDRVQRIRAEIIDKRSIVRYLVLFDAELFGNDAFNLFFNTAHSGSFS